MLHNQPLWAHLYRQLAPQVHEVVINANRHLDEYAKSDLQIIPDTLAGFPGPLAGMLAVLETHINEWYLFCACDTPVLPEALAARLWAKRHRGPIIWINDGERDHPTLALAHQSVTPALCDYLRRGERRVLPFFRETGGHALPVEETISNINTPEDLARLEYGEEK